MPRTLLKSSAQIGIAVCIISLFSAVGYVLSAPPGSPYNLGETLAPTCAPGAMNCTVVPPAASGDNSDILTMDALTNVGIGDPNPTIPLSILETSTAFADGDYFSQTVEQTMAPAGNQTTNVGHTAISGSITVDGANANDIGYGTGVAGYVENNGTGDVLGVLFGVTAVTQNNSSGAVNGMYALYASADNTAGTVAFQTGAYLDPSVGGGAVTDLYGLQTGGMGITGAGTVTNRYGIYIGTPVGTTTTGDWGLYQASSAQDNYFAGYVGLGTATPVNPLDIVATNAVADTGLSAINVQYNDSGTAGSGAFQEPYAIRAKVNVSGNYSSDAYTFPAGGNFLAEYTGAISGSAGSSLVGLYGDALFSGTTSSSGYVETVGGYFYARGNIGTTGDTHHVGVQVGIVSGTADINCGLCIQEVSGATTNYAINFAEQFVVMSSGSVGVGTNNPDQGKVEVKGGTVCVDTNSDDNATSCITSESDIRLKKNIQPIEGALDKIMQLRGVEFDWRWDEFDQISRYEGKPHDMGVIAQEVEAVFPEALGEDINGYKTVDYRLLVAPLIESVKELKQENDLLKELVCLDHPEAVVCLK